MPRLLPAAGPMILVALAAPARADGVASLDVRAAGYDRPHPPRRAWSYPVRHAARYDGRPHRRVRARPFEPALAGPRFYAWPDPTSVRVPIYNRPLDVPAYD